MFSIAPHPLSQANTHHQAIPQLNFWLSQKSTGSLEAGPEIQQSPRLSHHLYSAGNAPSPKQPPESWWGVSSHECQRQFPRGLQSSLCQRAQECPDPASQLPVKPEAGHSGEGPGMRPTRCRDIIATVSIMAHKHNPGHTGVFVEQKHSESLF